MPTPYAAPAQRRLFRRIGQKDSKLTHASASFPTVTFGKENKSTPLLAAIFPVKQAKNDRSGATLTLKLGSTLVL